MKRNAIILVTTMLLAAVIAGALSFTSSPVINNDAESDTTENLRCEWTSSGDTTQTNVSWYNGSSLFLNESSVSSPHVLGSGNTTRGESWNCTVTISNGTSTMNQSDIVTIVNADPSALTIYNETDNDIGNSTTIKEDVARTFNATTTDPDGDSLSYSTINLPDGATFSSSTGVMQWTPNASQVGTRNITFIALDDQSPDRGSTAKDIIFTVEEVNDNPVFDPVLQNQTATEGQAFTYSITATDEEDDTPLNFSISSALSNLIINSTGPTSANITFVGGSPSFEDRGNHTVNVTINDTRNGSNTSSFNLEVSPVNQLPNLSAIPNASGTQGQQFQVNFNATDKDVNDTLTFNAAAVGCSISNPWSVTKKGQGDNGSITQANATINLTLTNDHVVCPRVNVSVTDSKETAWQEVLFNITNINDKPVIHNTSTVDSNTFGNNITNQTAFANAAFSYTANGTDPDEQTNGGENLTFSDNTTLFNINSSTGLMSFTPNTSQLGNYTINISVSDDEGLTGWENMQLQIKNNTAPVIENPGNITCQEDVLCTKFINASDGDGDNITFTSNSTTFNITDYNLTHGVLNTTYNQSQVGNYTINVTATDIRGSSDSTTFTLIVNNTNDDPVLDPITFPSPIVETHPVRVDATATDQDIQLFGGGELLNYSSEFLSGSTLFNITTSFDNSTNISTGIMQFTPNSTSAGNYSVNVSVSDPSNSTDWQVVNFTVENKTQPPNISQIRPYGGPVSNTTVFSLVNTSNFTGTSTNVTIDENTTGVVFSHVTTDDTTAQTNLTYTWSYDGSDFSTSHNITKSFGFFSSGSHTMKLTVEDDKLENSTWTWNITVKNVNRNPKLINNLDNVTVNGTTTINNYLLEQSNVKFLDPDDDLNNNSELDENESNSLTFKNSACSISDITITDGNVKFSPTEIGSCSMTFNATDTSGASLTSNTILVNATQVTNSTTTTPTPTTSSGGGGGGGGSSSIVIPTEVEVETPQPLNLIAPEEVTIYRNRSITIPIMVHNTWNDTLENIQLGATTNNSEVDISFTKKIIEEVESGQRERLEMKVSNYRFGNSFEVLVNGTVDNPEFTDTALITFNAIEQTESGERAEVMVTFAKDLLTKNEECQELGELLNEAESNLKQGNNREANEMLDTIINGCQYLMGQTETKVEQPGRMNFDFIRRFDWFYAGMAALLLSFIAAIAIIEKRIRSEES